VVLEQVAQHVEDLRLDVAPLAAAPQLGALRVQLALPEDVDHGHLLPRPPAAPRAPGSGATSATTRECPPNLHVSSTASSSNRV
jgi:hypothetical protein